jgi:hypothetical protein
MSIDPASAPAPSAQNVILPSVQQQVATSLLGWLVQQDRLAVWSMLSSGVMASCAAYALFWVAPQQLAEIRLGYERIEKSHIDERKEVELRHQQHFSDMLTKVEAVTKAQSTLIEKLILREAQK